jgi:hypothetical protein
VCLSAHHHVYLSDFRYCAGCQDSAVLGSLRGEQGQGQGEGQEQRSVRPLISDRHTAILHERVFR